MLSNFESMTDFSLFVALPTSRATVYLSETLCLVIVHINIPKLIVRGDQMTLRSFEVFKHLPF